VLPSTERCFRWDASHSVLPLGCKSAYHIKEEKSNIGEFFSHIGIEAGEFFARLLHGMIETGMVKGITAMPVSLETRSNGGGA
jgi:hypothetical protein